MVWNKRMITTEDANSIIKHFCKGFVDYYTLDTRLLTTVDTWFAYDFIDVYRVTGSISFNVKNSLWTGGFRVVDSNISSPTVEVVNDTVVVSGTGLEWCILVLELSPEFNHGELFELDYEVEYTPVIRPFYETIGLTMGFLDGETPVTNMDVTDEVTGETLTTDSDGLVTVLSSIDKAGDYDYVLSSENNGVDVTYNFPYQRVHAELPVVLLNQSVYRDKTNLLEFKFLFDDEYDITESMLFTDNHIRLRCDNNYYEVSSYDTDTFRFNVPIGLNTYSNIVLEISGNDYVDNYRVEMNAPTSFVTVDSASALKSELEGDSPAGSIVFTGTVLDASITVSNDVHLMFDNDNSVIESSLDNVFTVTDGAVLKFDGVSFTGKTLASMDAGVVELVNSSFQHSTAPLVKGVGDLEVDDCSFVDNTTCLDVTGDVSLYNTLFDLSDTDYLDTGTPAFIRCFGDLSVDFCQFNLDLQGLTTLGLSYVMFFLGKNGSTNQVANNTLVKNEVFPMGKNNSEVNVESTNYRFTSKSNKCSVWTLENTNTVYSNKLNVEYIGGE